MNSIKFLSYYNADGDGNVRTASPAGMAVVDYVVKSVVNCGKSVELISPSWVIKPKERGFIPSKKFEIRDGVSITTCPSLSGCDILKKIMSRLWITLHLLIHIKRNEKIIIYHEPTLMFLVSLLTKIKKAKIIMICEELYSDTVRYKKIGTDNEIKVLEKAHSYIFPTELLSVKVNISNKPYIILHGGYNLEEDRNVKYDDGKIHVLYAGTFNAQKGGAFNAIYSAEFLPEDYHLHIIGFGTQDEKDAVVRAIENTRQKTKCTISFDGLKLGEEYIKFIQSCDIGLSTQNPSGSYNDSSFPSKVLSYLCNGLRVVSVKIKALTTSRINNMLFYCEDDTPRKIAEAIQSIDMSEEYNIKDKIRVLDRKFCAEILEHLGE